MEISVAISINHNMTTVADKPVKTVSPVAPGRAGLFSLIFVGQQSTCPRSGLGSGTEMISAARKQMTLLKERENGVENRAVSA